MFKLMIFVLALLLCLEEIQSAYELTGIQEVNVHQLRGGIAKATSNWSEHFPPLNGFAKPGAWHSKEGMGLPQSIWYEFKEALKVVKFSFQSRTDWTENSLIQSGASKYKFWGSNAIDCSTEAGRVVLVEDISGTPFTAENIPKEGQVLIPSSYRCYGFTITDTPSHVRTCMSNIRFWYDKGSK